MGGKDFAVRTTLLVPLILVVLVKILCLSFFMRSETCLATTTCRTTIDNDVRKCGGGKGVCRGTSVRKEVLKSVKLPKKRGLDVRAGTKGAIGMACELRMPTKFLKRG